MLIFDVFHARLLPKVEKAKKTYDRKITTPRTTSERKCVQSPRFNRYKVSFRKMKSGVSSHKKHSFNNYTNTINSSETLAEIKNTQPLGSSIKQDEEIRLNL